MKMRTPIHFIKCRENEKYYFFRFLRINILCDVGQKILFSTSLKKFQVAYN